MNVPGAFGARRPFVLGIGGTTRASSSSERALRAALEVARELGAKTDSIVGNNLLFPIYEPLESGRPPRVQNFLDFVRQSDGLIISSPGYHGTVSGLIKNVLDYLEDLRGDDRPYLSGRAVGCIACAAGSQAIGSTLVALRSVVHASRMADADGSWNQHRAG